MTPRGLVALALAGLCAGGAWAQQSVAGLAERPFADVADGDPIRVVDWRTGMPLPNALVFALAGEDRPRYFTDTPLAEQRDLYVDAARRSGLRVRIDDDGRGILPEHHIPFVIDGASWTAGNGPVLAPAPEREFVFRVVTHDGQPLAGHRLFGIESDSKGLVRWSPGPRLLAGRRYEVAGATGPPRMGMLPAGAAVIDLRDPDLGRDPIEVRRPPAGRLLLVGLRDGEPESIERLGVQYPVPFDSNGGFRFFTGVGAELLVDDLPLGVPIRIALPRGDSRFVTLAGPKPVRVELRVPAPHPRLRYRPVDTDGNLLELRGGQYGPTALEHGRIVIRWQSSGQRATIRFEDNRGEEWSCAPIELPEQPWRGVRDEGDLVLTRSSRSAYCSGRVVDEQGRPVATSVCLGDGHAVLGATKSDAEGRFQLNVGPWVPGPMPLYLPEYARMVTAPVERGGTDVLVCVGQQRTVHPLCRGQLLGLRDLPVWPHLTLQVRDAGSTRMGQHGPVRRDGRFGFSRPAGRHDVTLGCGDGYSAPTPVVRLDGFELTARHRVEPARLSLSLPEHLRCCAVRFVGTDGRPCPVPGIVSEPAATVQVFVPKRGGADVAFGPILRRSRVLGDRDIVFDPVIVDVEVAGLPAKGPWFFGLSARLAGADDHAPAQALLDGHGRLFAPRGASVELRLHAISFDERGLPEPAGGWRQVGLVGFEGRVEVPANGPIETIRLAAPADLAEQLAVLREPAERRRR